MRFLKRPRKDTGLLAVRLTGHTIQAASVEWADRPRVRVWQEAACGSVPERELARYARDWRMDRYARGLLLNPDEYHMHQVEAPRVPEEELKGAVRWRIKDLLDFPEEQATIDVLEIPSTNLARPPSVLAVAARNDVIKAHMDRFAQVGAPLSVVDIPELAQRNLAALFEEGGRGLAMLTFEPDHALLTFTCRQALYYARRIDLQLEQLLASGGEDANSTLERLTLEIQRSVDHFDRQFSGIPLSRLLVAPLSGGETLMHFLSEQIFVPVQVVELASVMDPGPLRALDAARQGAALLTLGAALRREDAA